MNVLFRDSRAEMIPGPTGVNSPGWSATADNAVDGGGVQVGQAGEGAQYNPASFGRIPAASFTVAGTGIRSIVFVRTNPSGQNTGFGVSFPVLDDLTLTPRE